MLTLLPGTNTPDSCHGNCGCAISLEDILQKKSEKRPGYGIDDAEEMGRGQGGLALNKGADGHEAQAKRLLVVRLQTVVAGSTTCTDFFDNLAAPALFELRF